MSCGQDIDLGILQATLVYDFSLNIMAAVEVRVIPKIAINDELPWTPELSVHSVNATRAFWSTKAVICLSVSLIVVVLSGVLIGALLVSINKDTGKSKYDSGWIRN